MTLVELSIKRNCKNVNFLMFIFIERIIKKRGNKLFVKWLGFDDSHNQWISKDDL